MTAPSFSRRSRRAHGGGEEHQQGLPGLGGVTSLAEHPCRHVVHLTLPGHPTGELVQQLQAGVATPQGGVGAVHDEKGGEHHQQQDHAGGLANQQNHGQQRRTGVGDRPEQAGGGHLDERLPVDAAGGQADHCRDGERAEQVGAEDSGECGNARLQTGGLGRAGDA